MESQFCEPGPSVCLSVQLFLLRCDLSVSSHTRGWRVEGWGWGEEARRSALRNEVGDGLRRLRRRLPPAAAISSLPSFLLSFVQRLFTFLVNDIPFRSDLIEHGLVEKIE